MKSKKVSTFSEYNPKKYKLFRNTIQKSRNIFEMSQERREYVLYCFICLPVDCVKCRFYAIFAHK